MAASKRILFAATILCVVPASAQDRAAPAAQAANSEAEAQKDVVEGATPEREALIATCDNHKFETTVEVDPVKKRSMRIKLCSLPGATDATWIKTLESAIAEIGGRRWPEASKEHLISQLRAEIQKTSIRKSAGTGTTTLGQEAFADPGLMANERFETSRLPSLDQPKKTVAVAGKQAKAQPSSLREMAFSIRCRDPGEREKGNSCAFFEKDTKLIVKAVKGFESGGTLRFLRRGDERARLRLKPMQPGQTVLIGLPAVLCKGVTGSKVEIELLSPDAERRVAARVGPYGLRC